MERLMHDGTRGLMDRLLQHFDICFSNPEDYLDGSVKLNKSCLDLNKELFSYCHDRSGRFLRGPLSILHTKGFDNEQIWEQIQLLNEPTIKFAKKKIKEIIEMKINLVDDDSSDGNGAEQMSEQAESDGESEEFVDGHANSDDMTPKQSARAQDVFFNLAEMNRFLQNEDRKYESRLDSKQDGDNDVDLFREMSSEEEDDRLMYDDFFDPPIDDKDNNSEKINSGEENDEIGTNEAMDESDQELSGDNEMDDNQLSSHQKQQQKLTKLIKKLEDENVAEKPWQLTGEVTSQRRPVNSLLEEVFTFDHMTRTAPIITEETTKSLEDIIKQRIIDEAWDDVVRKVKPVEKAFDYARAKPLDQEKSSLSLAEIYEQEFLKATQAESEEKEDKRHTEIKELMAKLFHKLDALSNFHFTPKPPKPDVKVVVNVPSLAIEEVTPSFQSDANLLAPEEIQAKPRPRDSVGATERTKTDKLRARRKKRKHTKMLIKSKASRQKLVSRLNLGLGNKFSKKAALKELETASKSVDFTDEADKLDKQLKSSKSFFEHLQDEVSSTIKSSRTAIKKKPKHTKSTSFFKL